MSLRLKLSRHSFHKYLLSTYDVPGIYVFAQWCLWEFTGMLIDGVGRGF